MVRGILELRCVSTNVLRLKRRVRAPCPPRIRRHSDPLTTFCAIARRWLPNVTVVTNTLSVILTHPVIARITLCFAITPSAQTFHAAPTFFTHDFCVSLTRFSEYVAGVLDDTHAIVGIICVRTRIKTHWTGVTWIAVARHGRSK